MSYDPLNPTVIDLYQNDNPNFIRHVVEMEKVGFVPYGFPILFMERDAIWRQVFILVKAPDTEMPLREYPCRHED